MWSQGSHHSAPTASTSPTRKRLPSRSFSRTPRVSTWRRISACDSSIPVSSRNASSASASTSVMSPRPK